MWWNLLYFAFITLLILYLFYSVFEKRRMQSLERKLAHMQRLLDNIADKLGVEEFDSKEDRVILELLLRGEKIKAIKRARELYAMDLLEAKTHVEQLEKKTYH
jgi:ribosomal protein L7/L12